MRDLLVVVSGWVQIYDPTMLISISSLRLVRVLRRIISLPTFRGMNAITGALVHNTSLFQRLFGMMLFALIIFGTVGINLFPGKLQHRCVVSGAYPSQTSGVYYNSSYAAAGEAGSMGKFEYFCDQDGPLASFTCPSNMHCDMEYANPNYGSTSFDDFGSALLLMFQVMPNALNQD